jgi:hypothetical protein
MPGLKFWPSHGAPPISELDVVSISAPSVPLCWWGAACYLRASKIEASYPISGFRPVWRRNAYQFTVLRMVSARPVSITPRELSGVLKTTRLRQPDLLIQR